MKDLITQLTFTALSVLILGGISWIFLTKPAQVNRFLYKIRFSSLIKEEDPVMEWVYRVIGFVGISFLLWSLVYTAYTRFF